MLYPTIWLTRAALIGIDIPVKNILKNADVSNVHTRKLTNPSELIRRHFTGSGKLESVSQSNKSDVTQTNEDDYTDEENVP